MTVVVDTSVLIDVLRGESAPLPSSDKRVSPAPRMQAR